MLTPILILWHSYQGRLQHTGISPQWIKSPIYNLNCKHGGPKIFKYFASHTMYIHKMINTVYNTLLNPNKLIRLTLMNVYWCLSNHPLTTFRQVSHNTFTDFIKLLASICNLPTITCTCKCIYSIRHLSEKKSREITQTYIVPEGWTSSLPSLNCVL